MLLLRCEACGNVIECVEQGWMEWIDRLKEGRRVARRVRIVHNLPTCRYPRTIAEKDECIGDRPLKDFLGVAGMSLLCEKVQDGQFSAWIAFRLLKRLYIEGYEKWLWDHRKHDGRIYWRGTAA